MPSTHDRDRQPSRRQDRARLVVATWRRVWLRRDDDLVVVAVTDRASDRLEAILLAGQPLHWAARRSFEQRQREPQRPVAVLGPSKSIWRFALTTRPLAVHVAAAYGRSSSRFERSAMLT